MAGGDAQEPTPDTASDEIERKRARDRRSQQAKRDRAKKKLLNLTEQVEVLKETLSEQNDHTRSVDILTARVTAENKQLQLQNSSLRLALSGQMNSEALVEPIDTTIQVPLWRIPLSNTAPTNYSDSIWQGVVTNERVRTIMYDPVRPATPQSPKPFDYSQPPDLCALVDKSSRSMDEISNAVCDVVRRTPQVEALTTQVAVTYNLIMVLRWQVQLDEESWNQIPEWLRPIQIQMMVPHGAWIDFMPWPKMRKYLIEHQEVTLVEDMAGIYSSSLRIKWPYDPGHVLLPADVSSGRIVPNPIYSDHIRQLSNWTVDEPFRSTFPKLAAFVDEVTGD